MNQENNQGSRGFRMMKNQAVRLLTKRAGIAGLLLEAGAKLWKHRSELKDNKENFRTLLRMLEQWFKGNYALPWRSLVAVVATLLYFVNPLDIIPDILVGLGFLDDIAVLAFALRQIGKDVEKFKEWEQTEMAEPLHI